MPYVYTGPRRIRKHIQSIDLFFFRICICFERFIFQPMLLPFLFNLLMVKGHLCFLLFFFKKTLKKATHPYKGTRSFISRGTTQISIDVMLTLYPDRRYTSRRTYVHSCNIKGEFIHSREQHAPPTASLIPWKKYY